MLLYIRNSKFSKVLSAFLAISILHELIAPNMAMALTGGPSQPEVQSFEPVGTSEMVDLFSGDFNYNIPLMDVGGYPINISYHSGVTMDQEASWVGLGWNINPGVINRNMRGIPDDFKGDKITKELNMKANTTIGLSAGVGAEFFGIDGLTTTFGLGVNYNNYTGIGFEKIFNNSFSSGRQAMGSLNGGLGITSSSTDGLTINPNFSFDVKVTNECNIDQFIGGSIGTSFNSRVGVKSLSLGVSYEGGKDYSHRAKHDSYQANKWSGGVGSSISFGMSTYVPKIDMPMVNTSATLSFKAGPHMIGLQNTWDFSGYYSSQRLSQKTNTVSAYGYLNMDEGSIYDSDVALDFNREKDGAFNENTPDLPVTNFTYDVYSVSGQGIGGMYRPFRSDLGYVYDSHNSNTSDKLLAWW